MPKPLIVEARSADEANRLELEGYRYDGYSRERDCYVMIRRKGV